jgi:hypothetical protein
MTGILLPGGGVADPPGDLEYDVFVFVVLRVDRCSEARYPTVNMWGWVWFSNFSNMGIWFFSIKNHIPPHIFTAKNLASEHLSTLNTSNTISYSKRVSTPSPPGRALYLNALLSRRPPNPNPFLNPNH